MGTHNVHSQDSAIVSMTNHLDHATRLAHGYRTTTGDEGESAHFVRNPAIAGFLLGNANTGYFGLGKDTIRDSVIIGLTGMTKGILNGYLSLIKRKSTRLNSSH